MFLLIEYFFSLIPLQKKCGLHGLGFVYVWLCLMRKTIKMKYYFLAWKNKMLQSKRRMAWVEQACVRADRCGTVITFGWPMF